VRLDWRRLSVVKSRYASVDHDGSCSRSASRRMRTPHRQNSSEIGVQHEAITAPCSRRRMKPMTGLLHSYWASRGVFTGCHSLLPVLISAWLVTWHGRSGVPQLWIITYAGPTGITSSSDRHLYSSDSRPERPDYTSRCRQAKDVRTSIRYNHQTS
jgi:hypothetical protein